MVDLSNIPDQMDLSGIPMANPVPDFQESVHHSQLFDVPVSDVYNNKTNIRKLLKDKAASYEPEKVETKMIKSGLEKGSFGALIPYIGLSAFKGLTDIIFKPIGATTPLKTDKLISEAVEYWKKKSPDIKFTDIGLGRPEDLKIPTDFWDALKSWLTDFEIQKRQGSVKQIAGTTAELAGFVGGPLRIAGGASELMVQKTAKSARPFFQSIYRGMATGALTGEGEKDKTLESMALFGIFDGLTGFLGRISTLPKIITESETYRKLTIKEKGLVLQSLDEAIKGAERHLEILKEQGANSELLEAFAQKSEGEILRDFNNPAWQKEALKKRLEPEMPSETPSEPISETVKTETKPTPPSEGIKVAPKGGRVAIGKVRADQIKTISQLADQAHVRATEKVSKEIEKEIKHEDPFIKELGAVESLKKRGDERIGQRLKEEDITVEFEKRVLDEEIKILRKLIKKTTVNPKLKKIIRENTGQIKVKDIIEVDTRQALKDQIRFEAKAAREAFRAGKKEAALKHKLKQRELTIKAREAKKQKDTINKIIKDFKKVARRLDPKKTKKYAGFPKDQAKAIRDLLADLDFVKPTKKTLKSLLGTRAYLTDNPQATLPSHVLKDLERLEKTPVRDLVFDDLVSIHQAVMHHVKLAETINSIKVKMAIREEKQVLRESIESLNLPEDIIDRLEEIVDGSEIKKRGIGKIIKNNLGIRQDGYDLIIESIAGPESIIYDVLFKQVKTGTKKVLKTEQSFYDFYNAQKKQYGFKAKDLNKWADEIVTTGRIQLTRAQRVALYLHSLNDDNLTAIMEGGFGFKFSKDPNKVYRITEEELNEVLDSLDSNEKAVANATADLMTETKNQIAPKFLKLYGYEMPTADPYFPKDVMPLERKADLDTETDKLLKKFEGRFVRPGIPKGFLEKRVGSKAPIYLNPVFDVVNEVISNASSFIGLEEPLSNASKLLYNKEFRKALQTKYKDNIIWKEIDKGLKDIAGLYDAVSSYEKALLVAKDKLTSAIFGLNPFIIMIQPLSYPMYLRYIKPEYLMQAQFEFWQNPNKMIQEIRSFSPEFRQRLEGGFNKDLAELAHRTVNKKIGGKPTLAQKLTGGIKGGDLVSVTPGFKAAVRQTVDNLNNGIVTDDMRVALDIAKDDLPHLSAEDKVNLGYRFAEFATNRTQPTYMPEHRPPMSRGTPIEKTVTMFGSFTNRVLNMIRREWRSYKRAKTPKEKSKSMKRLAQILFLAGVVNTVGMIGRDDLRDFLYGRKNKNKKLMLRVLKNWSSYIFIIRDIMNSAVSMSERGIFGYDVDYVTDKAFQLPANIISSTMKLFYGKNDKERQKAAIDFADGMTELIFLSKGLPYQNFKNLGKIAAAEHSQGIGGAK